MRMFESFENESEGYIPNNLPKPPKPRPLINTTHSFSAAIPVFNIKDEFTGFEWNRGDIADIPFEVDGYILDSEDELEDIYDYIDSEGAEMVMTDWMGYDVTEINSYEVIEGSDSKLAIVFHIDNETSSELPPGTYHARVKIGEIEIHAPFDSMLTVR